jgi:hypothetical protein
VRRLLLLECIKQPRPASQVDMSSSPAAAAAAEGLGLFNPKLKHAWQQQQLLDLQQIALASPGSSSSSSSSSADGEVVCDGLSEWGQQWHPRLLDALLWEMHHADLGWLLIKEIEEQLQLDSNTPESVASCTTCNAADMTAAAGKASSSSSSSSRLTSDFVEPLDQQVPSKLPTKHQGDGSDLKNSSRDPGKHTHGSSSSSSSTVDGEAAARQYVRSCMGMLSRAALSSWMVSWYSCMEEAGGSYSSSSMR